MEPSFITDQSPGRIVQVDGVSYRWFSGTDYLGMGQHRRLKKLLVDGIDKLGTHFGSSRNNPLQISTYREAEISLAEFTGAEDALLVSSGMLAGCLVRLNLLSVLKSVRPATIYIDHEAPALHPALAREIRHLTDWNSWAAGTIERIRNSSSEAFHIVYADAIGSPIPSFRNFEDFQKFPNVLLVLDDSHGIGVTGTAGRGISGLIGQGGASDLLVIASLNKALGIPGGAILGNRLLLDCFRKTAFYSGASPVSPGSAYALNIMLQSGEYVRANRAMLENNNYFLNRLTGGHTLTFQPGYPVYTSRDTGLFRFLLENSVLTSCFSYPSPDAPPNIRLVITAQHNRKDLDLLSDLCNSYFK